MESLCHPKTIALIGASKRRRKSAYVILNYLRDWQGRLYLVNPREREIMGREVYADVCRPSRPHRPGDHCPRCAQGSGSGEEVC